MASDSNQNNIAFTCFLSLGKLEKCIDILVSTGRYAEAVIFSKTYKPSLVAGLVKLWKAELVNNGKEKIAKTIASPDGNLERFTGWTDSLEVEITNSGPVANEGKAPFIQIVTCALENGIKGFRLATAINGELHHAVVA
jgi:coatomer subunit beta'